MEGESRIVFRGRSETLRAHGFLLHSSHDPLTFTSAAPVARIEVRTLRWITDDHALPALAPPHDQPTLLWRTLTATLNSLFTDHTAVQPHALSLLTLSVETLIEALSSEAVPLEPDTHPQRRPPDSLPTFQRAIWTAKTQASDPTLSVERLARACGVTRTHLAHLFNEQGLTARGVIQRERIEIARRVRAQDPTISDQDLARRAGFRSTPQLREMLGADTQVAP